ncbi:hypothetical protein DE146DRAFT_631459 [Phaeosphaeria sp. MPI-PUGE-AT-0046c]|nr:hypothetical protein DE146DRAFT_631459 [Phaeosphaeria sp. MPI-PUGE-AT-0046c]
MTGPLNMLIGGVIVCCWTITQGTCQVSSQQVGAGSSTTTTVGENVWTALALTRKVAYLQLCWKRAGTHLPYEQIGFVCHGGPLMPQDGTFTDFGQRPRTAVSRYYRKVCVKRCKYHKPYFLMQSCPVRRLSAYRLAWMTLGRKILNGGISALFQRCGFHEPGEGPQLRLPRVGRVIGAGRVFLDATSLLRFHRSGHPLQIAVARPNWSTKPFKDTHLPASPQAKVVITILQWRIP